MTKVEQTKAAGKPRKAKAKTATRKKHDADFVKMSVAVNKMRGLQNELDESYAIGAPPLPEPIKGDLVCREVTPFASAPLMVGWAYFPSSVSPGWVLPGWTGEEKHGFGSPPRGKEHISSTPGHNDLYATQRDALIALRNETRRQFGETLVKIDRLIKEAG